MSAVTENIINFVQSVFVGCCLYKFAQASKVKPVSHSKYVCTEFSSSLDRYLFPVLSRKLFIGAAVLLPAITVANENPLLSDRASRETVVNDWVAYDKTTPLVDGSELFQYVAEVAHDIEDNKKPVGLNPIIRFSFIPRFNCTPIISVVLTHDSDPDSQSRIDLLTALDGLSFSIDNASIEFPVLTESQATVVAAHYDSDLQRRNTLRLLVEVGRRVIVSIEGYGDFKFSLLGSTRAITRSRERCANHTV